ncbi:MAG: DUF1549 domain-containing protein [Planctomycetaceae bacterium]
MSLAWLFVVVKSFVQLVQDVPNTSSHDNTRASAVAVARPPLSTDDRIHFDTEIVPVLTKAGCNSGACHGAAAGRAAFKLSLFGSDPEADYFAIVHQFEGRRINTAKAELSLLLRKPTGELNHEGGTPLLDDETGRDVLLNWIRSGAKRGAERRLLEVQVNPSRKVVDSVPSTIPLQVIATFDDETKVDVTRWTVFSVSDPSAIIIEQDQAARIIRRGQHVVIARFLNRVIPITFVVPLADRPVDLSRAERVNLIDEHVLNALQELRIPLSPSAEDSQWLRRVTLDLTGQLPIPEEVEQFLASEVPNKREQVVDRLLDSESYADVWTLRFSRLLRMHSLPNETEALQAYSAWLRKAIAADVGVDQLAKELLTATGDSHLIGPANFGRMVSDARVHAELVGQVFAGVRLGCANCHNHPLDKWTQDDYHGLAAVFAPWDRSRNVKMTSRGQVTNLRTGEPATPRIPGVRDLTHEEDRLLAVHDWITNDKDLLLARATTNRVWRFLFGRGLIEPVDDLRDTNPATHPELLQQLAREFAANGYRLRPLLRTMVLSATYGRSDQVVTGNETDDRFYSRSLRRPMDPEVFMDAIADVTDVAGDFGSHKALRAVQVIDSALPAEDLDVLGRCQRVNGCSEGESASGGLPAQLHLLNGDLINMRLRDPNGRLQKLIAENKSVRDIIDEFYVRGLGRHALADELTRWETAINDSDPIEQQRRLEDFVWSLLNSRDFRENH